MKRILLIALTLLLAASLAQAQSSTTGTTTLSVAVGPEAAIVVNTATSDLTSPSIFADYAGTTDLTYRVRTSGTGVGSGTIVLQVTSDFGGPAGGPRVASPPAGTSLTYTCTDPGPGTACTGSITALTASTTNVSTIGANAYSTIAGTLATVVWTLTNSPAYPVATYNATATFTISAA